MFYRKQPTQLSKRLTLASLALAAVGALVFGIVSSTSPAFAQTPPRIPNPGGQNQGGATANPQPLQNGGQNDLLNRNNSHPYFNPANIRQDYTYADPNNAPFVPREVHPMGHDEVVDRKSVGPGQITLHDVYKWPVEIPTATSPLATKRDEGIGDHMLKTWGYPISDTQYQMIHRYNQNIMLAEMFDPERVMWTMGSMGNMQMQNTADSAANLERNQAASAIDFTASYLYNFTVDQGNRWNKIRDQLFIPMAILILLPGAVLAQVKAIVSAGTPVIQDVSSPFEGILRSIVAIFLIPATYLVINYGIDVANSITYTIASEYKRIFNSDMYKDALCLHVRAFPIRMAHENDNGIFRPPTQWDQLDPKGPKNQTPAAVMEGQTTSNMLEDPCANTRIVPPERTNEAAPFVSTSERAMMGISNAGLAATWNILCAFQMAYLYYLWCVGPVVAALWVWPSKQLREALPSWTEGVVTLCFWSLFWNTVVLLMACFRGVDDTGSVITAALLFLSNAAVKYAFDFAGLVKAAGQAAAGQALGQAGKMGQSAGAGVGASKSAGKGSTAASSGPSSGHAAASHAPGIGTGTSASTGGTTVGTSSAGHTPSHASPFGHGPGGSLMSGGGYGYSGAGAEGGGVGGGAHGGGSFSMLSAADGGGGGSGASSAGFVPPPIAGFGADGSDAGGGASGFFGAQDSDVAAAAAGIIGAGSVSYTGGGSTFGASYNAFSTASHAAFHNQHMNAMHALHAQFGAGTGGHGHGHGVTPPGMNSKEAAVHMLALQAAQQHMNDLKLHAPQIDASASHNFSASFNTSLGGLDTSYNSMNQQLMNLAASNPAQFSQFANSDGSLDYARMANSADIIDFDQLNVSDTDYNSMATEFSNINAATSQAEQLARDVQGTAMAQALGQQQAQTQQQIQAEQDKLMQQMLAGTAPGQQQAVQQALQQQQQQQQQEIQQLLARQAQDSMQVAQQMQQQYNQQMQGPNAAGASQDPAVAAHMQQQAQQQAQQAWQQHVQQQQAAVAAQMQQQAQQMQQLMQQQQMQQAMQNNPAAQAVFDQTQQNIQQAVQTAMQQQQQAVYSDVQTQLSRIASDAASSANVMAVGQASAVSSMGSISSIGSGVDTTGIAYGAAGNVYHGDTIHGDTTYGSIDGGTVYNPNYSYDVSTGQAYNDNAMQFTSYTGGALNSIDSSSTIVPPANAVPNIDTSVVQGSAGSQIIASTQAAGQDIVASAGAQLQQEVRNQMEARAAETGNAISAGYVQPSVIQQQQAGLIDTVAQNFQQNLTGSNQQFIDQSGQVNNLAREVSAAATAAGAALGMSSLVSGNQGGTSVHYVQGPGGQGYADPSLSGQRVVDIQGRQLARNSYQVVDTSVSGAGPASLRGATTGSPGAGGQPQARYTPTTGGKHIAMRGGPAMNLPGRAGRVSGATLNAMRGQPGGQGSGSAFTRALGKGTPVQGGRPGTSGSADMARKSVNDPFGEVHLASLRNRSRSRDKKAEQDDLQEFGENMNWEV